MEKITPEQIAVRAYQRFVERGGQHGHDVEDWMAAEADLRRLLGRYEVLLVEPGARVIELVRTLRERTGLELREIKDLVDTAPAVLSARASADEADALKAELEQLGARVELRALVS